MTSIPEGAIIQSTHERMQDVSRAPIPRQYVDSIVTEGMNSVYAYTNTGKSYFARQVLYHLATDMRIPGVTTDLNPGQHLKCTFIDPEQPNSNLHGWNRYHNALTHEQQMLADANIREIRSPEGFTHNLAAFRDKIKEHVDKGKHLDLGIVDSFGMLYGRGHRIQDSAEMDLMMDEIFKELQAFDSLLLLGHMTRGSYNQRRQQVPDPEGSTHFENMIQGNLVCMFQPLRDPWKRCFVHKKQKDTYGKVSYTEDRPLFVLDTNIDVLTPFARSDEQRTYLEWMEAPQADDDFDAKFDELYRKGGSKKDAARLYIELNPKEVKLESAERHIRRMKKWDFDIPADKRDNSEKLPF